MNFFNKPPDFKDRADVFLFFLGALDYREAHPEESEKIALFVFDATHKFIFDNDIETIRNEFGALEAPGEPENGNPDDYREALWTRLRLMVERMR